MAEPALAAIGLSRSFGALRAVDDVSLDIRRGEIHALIGPNGAGKSTLIALLSGALRPDAGRIRLDGRDITGMGPARRARAGLGRSFQIPAVLAEATLREAAITAALGARGLGRVLWRRAEGLAEPTEAGERALHVVGLGARASATAASLSHGERRRLDVALALATRPRVLLLDEPMAGLGPEGGAAITALISDLRHEAGILLVEHDMDAVFRLADRITVLDAGRLLATGTPAAIRTDIAVRAAYLGETGQ